MQDPYPEPNVGLSRAWTHQVLAQSKMVIQVLKHLGRSSLGPLLSTQQAIKTLGQPQIRVNKPHIGPQTQEEELDSSPRTVNSIQAKRKRWNPSRKRRSKKLCDGSATESTTLLWVFTHSHFEKHFHLVVNISYSLTLRYVSWAFFERWLFWLAPMYFQWNP